MDEQVGSQTADSSTNEATQVAKPDTTTLASGTDTTHKEGERSSDGNDASKRLSTSTSTKVSSDNAITTPRVTKTPMQKVSLEKTPLGSALYWQREPARASYRQRLAQSQQSDSSTTPKNTPTSKKSGTKTPDNAKASSSGDKKATPTDNSKATLTDTLSSHDSGTFDTTDAKQAQENDDGFTTVQNKKGKKSSKRKKISPTKGVSAKKTDSDDQACGIVNDGSVTPKKRPSTSQSGSSPTKENSDDGSDFRSPRED